MQSTMSLTWEGENRSSNCLNCRLQQRTSWVSTHGIPRGIHEYAWLRPIMYSLHLQCEGLCVFVRRAPARTHKPHHRRREAPQPDAERRHLQEGHMAQGKTSSFFNRVEVTANPAIAKVDADKKATTARKRSDREILSPGFMRPVQVTPAPAFPDFPAVEPGPNAGRRTFVPAHRNPVAGGDDQSRGGAKEALTKLYA